jgi:two-component sensor histidine kinase
MLDLVGGGPDVDFDRLAQTAAWLAGAPIGLVTLVDQERQTFSGAFGTELRQSATDTSFCAHVMALDESESALVVPDALLDARFANNPLVTGAPHLRFYAGVPLVISGQKVGTLCVFDLVPREGIDATVLVQLANLSQVAASLYALKEESRVRARTAAALMREEWRHALTLEAGKVGSWMWEVATGEVTCNDLFRRMYELPETGPVRVEQIMASINETDRASAQEVFAKSLADGADFSSEARVGSGKRWITMRGRVYQRDEDGRPLLMMGASIDVTESKQSAGQTRLLLRELNHRVKNTLAMIQSVARQTISRTSDPEAFIGAFSGRLRTISDAHILLADRDWSGVRLHEVLASQLGPNFLISPNRADISGDDTFLPPDHALGLGLILHELTTNALRHGAWSTESGRVSIQWTLTDGAEPGLDLKWQEMGGPAVSRPSAYGLGARLIERSLAKVLDSKVKLDFPTSGVEVHIWLPLPNEEAAGAF